MFVPFLLLGVVVEALTIVPPRRVTSLLRLQPQKLVWLGDDLPTREEMEFLLPIHDPEPSSRALEISQKRLGYLYGPSLLGNSSYFPTGILGDAMVQQHQHDWYADSFWLVNTVNEEMPKAATALEAVSVI